MWWKSFPVIPYGLSDETALYGSPLYFLLFKKQSLSTCTTCRNSYLCLVLAVHPSCCNKDLSEPVQPAGPAATPLLLLHPDMTLCLIVCLVWFVFLSTLFNRALLASFGIITLIVLKSWKIIICSSVYFETSVNLIYGNYRDIAALCISWYRSNTSSFFERY